MDFGLSIGQTENSTMGWPVVLLFANTTLLWMTDFFHAMYRQSTNLQFIKNCRIAYLCLASLRICNSVLLIFSTIQAAVSGSILAVALIGGLGVGYTYTSLLKCVQFVYRFDCESYYKTHQEVWYSSDKVDSQSVEFELTDHVNVVDEDSTGSDTPDHEEP